jgi:hypothetical protein
VQRAPGFPCALCFGGQKFLHNSGASRREKAESRSQIVMPRFKRGILYADVSYKYEPSLEYWIAWSSRAMTQSKLFEIRIGSKPVSADAHDASSLRTQGPIPRDLSRRHSG